MEMHCLETFIYGVVRQVLNEMTDGSSPDYVRFMGDTYVALQDSSETLLYYNGKWLHNADTHRDIICLAKYGCEEWELSDYYGRETADRMRWAVDRLWSDSNVFRYLSRIYKAKRGAEERGIGHVLVSWDELSEDVIRDMCSQLGIERSSLAYVK